MRCPERELQHRELLELGRRVQRSATVRDRNGVVTEAHRLLTALATHFDDERQRFRPEDETSRGLARGEQKVVELFVDLGRVASVGSPAEAPLEQLAHEALSQLRRQVEVEASAVPVGDRAVPNR